MGFAFLGMGPAPASGRADRLGEREYAWYSMAFALADRTLRIDAGKGPEPAA
jgi:hypothetical protein